MFAVSSHLGAKRGIRMVERRFTGQRGRFLWAVDDDPDRRSRDRHQANLNVETCLQGAVTFYK